MIIGANVRFGSTNTGTNGTKIFSCQPNHASEASILFTIALLGIVANAAIMALIIGKANLRRYFLSSSFSLFCIIRYYY